MPWVASRDWVAAEVVTAGQMNQELSTNYDLTAPGIVTTKGDLVIGTGANTTTRLAVGAAGQVLVGDSATGSGWKWADSTAAPSGMVIFMASAACPSGWTELTGAQGRAILATPASGGSPGTTTGSAQGDLADATHTHAGASHTHTLGAQNIADDLGQYAYANAVSSAATAATSETAANSDSFSYIQLRVCEKD
jgi:hypothetical protein